MIRKIDDKEYEIIVEWWKAHNWQPINKLALPTTGYISYDNDKPIIAGYLYLSDSAFAWIEWIISNPDSTYDQRELHFKELIGSLVLKAKEHGVLYISTCSNKKSLIEKYKNNGFIEGDNGLVNLLMMTEV